MAIGEIYHILPVDDLKPHTESGKYCKCQPVISESHDNTGHTLVIHNSYDGREFFERDAIPRGH
jgi:hypothetical protein